VTAVKVTQQAVEVLSASSATPNVCVTQQAVEVLSTSSATPNVCVTQQVVEVLSTRYFFNITGNIIENTDIATWRVVALDAVTGEFKQTTTSSSSAYTLPKPYTTSAVLVCYPKIDRIWTTVTVVALNDFCVPADPDTTPKLYQATSIGSAPNKTGAGEPAWPVSGTVADGDITWTYIADLIDPLGIGPRKPT